MHRAAFDSFADEYESMHASNIRASGEAPAFFAAYKIRDVAQSLKEMRLAPARILDFGAGIGTSVPYFRELLPTTRLTCLDVSERSLDIGRRKYAGVADFQLFDGITIPFPEESFDVCFAACVFHHIDADAHIGMLRELHRILRPGGAAFIFEHNPYNPLTARAVRDCPFDEDAILITAPDLRARVREAGFSQVRTAYRIFFPGPLRALRVIEPWLKWCALGAQYYLQARKR